MLKALCDLNNQNVIVLAECGRSRLGGSVVTGFVGVEGLCCACAGRKYKFLLILWMSFVLLERSHKGCPEGGVGRVVSVGPAVSVSDVGF
jgi:hypothetical protein